MRERRTATRRSLASFVDSCPGSDRVRDALPDFFVLGVAKAGTTSLHHYLRQHPSLFLPYVKELHFFDGENGRFPSALDRYLGYFADAGPRLAGEATVSYFRHVDAVADRMVRLYGDTVPRFLILLRDPAERAYSHYLHNVSEGRESDSFAAALEAERARPEEAGREWKAYFTDGVYADTLARWFEAFSRERFLVLLSDDLRHDRESAVRRTFSFLGVDPEADVDTGRCLNRTGERQSRALGRLVSHLPDWLPALARRGAPEAVRLRVEQFLRRRNTGSGEDRPTLDPKLESRLRHRYAPHVRRLEGMIDRDLSDWLPADEVRRGSDDR